MFGEPVNLARRQSGPGVTRVNPAPRDNTKGAGAGARTSCKPARLAAPRAVEKGLVVDNLGFALLALRAKDALFEVHCGASAHLAARIDTVGTEDYLTQKAYLL